MMDFGPSERVVALLEGSRGERLGAWLVWARRDLLRKINRERRQRRGLQLTVRRWAWARNQGLRAWAAFFVTALFAAAAVFGGLAVVSLGLWVGE